MLHPFEKCNGAVQGRLKQFLLMPEKLKGLLDGFRVGLAHGLAELLHGVYLDEPRPDTLESESLGSYGGPLLPEEKG